MKKMIKEKVDKELEQIFTELYSNKYTLKEIKSIIENKFEDFEDNINYGETGYNVSGFDKEGYDREGYDFLGYDREGYNEKGYDKRGYNRYGTNSLGYSEDQVNSR